MLDRAASLRPKAAHVWDRDPHDWFVEPPSVTAALLTVERFVGAIWDPACGTGTIAGVLTAAGYLAHGTDVVHRGAGLCEQGWRGCRDFLADDRWLPEGAANVVTNSPFFRARGTESFARKALRHATGKVCVFADIRFLTGAARAAGLFAEHPPTRVWALTPRVSCPPGEYLAAGGKAQGGTADWCWITWDLTAPRGDTRFGWLKIGSAA